MVCDNGWVRGWWGCSGLTIFILCVVSLRHFYYTCFQNAELILIHLIASDLHGYKSRMKCHLPHYADMTILHLTITCKVSFENLWHGYGCGSYVLQSHNRILRAAAGGDVAALRRVIRETDPVLIAAVQNKVCCMLYCPKHTWPA